jgi:hypothetical protein
VSDEQIYSSNPQPIIISHVNQEYVKISIEASRNYGSVGAIDPVRDFPNKHLFAYLYQNLNTVN